jgi:LacI family transcriptional regulator
MSLNKKDINSFQIAKLAGVSRSTVSRVINNYSNVPEETREKVMKVIQQYDYYPNISARILAGKKTGTIGLFWITEDRIATDYLSNFFIASIIDDAASFGYLVLTCVVSNLSDPENIQMIKKIFFQGRIDGGIFIGSSNNEPLIEELIAEGHIIGILDQNIPGRTEANRIIVNFDSDTGEKAVDYLVKLNHRKIGIINGDIHRYNGMQKYNGFMNGLKKNGLEIINDWIEYATFSDKDGYASMSTILQRSKELPTAICCANDSIAFGVVNAINDFGLKVPDDISVIGIDDHIRSSTFRPPLTTFRVDFSKMMSALTENVINVIKGKANEFISLEFGSELIERESCRKN